MKPVDGGLCEPMECLASLRGSKTVVVCIGNTLKGDDAAGIVLYQKVTGKLGAKVIDAGTVPENYIGYVKRCRCDNALIVDAIDFGAEPGNLRVFTRDQIGAFAFSTHALSPRMFADIIAEDLAGDLYFVGIQPAQTQLGQPISLSVAVAVDELAVFLLEIFPAGTNCS